MNKQCHRILFITSCPEPWGGSEELWAGAARLLQQAGHWVAIGRTERISGISKHRRWKLLRESGLKLESFGTSWYARNIPDLITNLFPFFIRPAWWIRNVFLAIKLRGLSPDLVVICQGQAYDACYPLSVPEVCRFAGIPYILICQKASELTWPVDGLRELLRRCYQQAKAVYFVSYHNRRIVESQLALYLPSAEVVQNPFMVKISEPLPWPSVTDGQFRLACVGRLWPQEKAQDILLYVLSKEHWRSRPIQMSFFGEGPMAMGLQQLAKRLALPNIHFPGFLEPTDIWRTHHALVLPSRAEGLPLAQVEAMICGRPVIVANAGGTAEIMQHGKHGFLAASATESALDLALEEAWQRRDQWQAIGQCAADHVRRLYPSDPCAAMRDKILTICQAKTESQSINN